MLISADESGGEEPVQFNGARQSGRGPQVRQFVCVFVFLGSIIICRLYKLTSSEQAQVILYWESVSDLV
jgi:hypothetical protein